VSSYMGHFFTCDSNHFAPDVASFIVCFLGKMGTLSTVILPYFKKRFFNKNPTVMLGVLADDVMERIGGSGF